ncbi:MAG: STAS domain-containing protein [Lachnospiraceae bacterium]|nr:STAS domain-containing protein [Lachnospiraceae bacterium]
MKSFKPKIFSVMKNYTKEQFIKDVISGIIVAIIALPLSIAFALGAGVSAEKGIYAAIISSLIGAFLGGSRVQISGPTGAFIVITQSVILSYGMNGLAISMIMAGIFLVLLGVFKLGRMIKFIPSPITVGFTAGIGVTIFTLEVKDFLGLSPEAMPTNFFGKWGYYLTHLNEVNWQSVTLALVCIVILVIWPRFNKKIPNSLIAIIVGTVATQLLHLDVKLLGEIPKSLGAPVVPGLSFEVIQELISPSFTIAILVAMQALLSAVVTDGIINSRTNSHVELVAHGVSNIILGFFGCIPTTGGVARGVQSAQNGARTPIAAIVHSISLFIFLIVLMPFIKLVPLPVLAAILMVVSYNMLNVNVLIGYLKRPKSDLAVLICSCVLTFAFDLVFAIEVGLIMAAFLFMKRMSDVTEVQGWKYINDENDPDSLTLRKVPDHTLVYEVSGPMFFAVSDKILKITGEADTKCIIIRMRSVNSIDATAMNTLEQLLEKCQKKGITLILSHVNAQPRKLMDNVGFLRKIGKVNLCDNIDKALMRAKEVVEE